MLNYDIIYILKLNWSMYYGQEIYKIKYLSIHFGGFIYISLLDVSRILYIYINFLFYIVLAVYFKQRKDFSIKEWGNSVRKGSIYWKQVMLTILFCALAFAFTNVLANMFPNLNNGMIKLRADNWLKLILFICSTIILPPIAEEIFYRKNLISFKNRKILVLTTLFSMFLYALEHALAIWGIFLCMIWALPLSISYIKTKNIYVTMTAHFICDLLVNGIAVVKVCDFLLS